MKKYTLIIFILLTACKGNVSNQESAPAADPLFFTVINEVPTTSISNQIFGTCWAFSTASFLESEIYRTKRKFINLSAMYFVRNAYLQKAQNYILRQGTARFTEGGCNYDPLINIDKFGIMPQSAYSGLANGYSLAIDLDLVEPGVYLEEGYATVPDSIITAEKRQLDFESFATTDDHNMHIVAKAKDQYGRVYYKCKNSWGEYGRMKGYVYLSEPYVRAKSIYVMLHKGALTETTQKRIKTAQTYSN